MTLPPPLAAEVEGALGGRIIGLHPVSGGCINQGARLTTDRGDAWFLKWNPSAPPGMFDAEARGLRALGGAAALRVPSVRAIGTRWLLLEWIERGRPSATYARDLGVGLATLHASIRASPGPEGPSAWGWESDNFLGSLPQPNPEAPSWGEFWRDARLAPLLARARAGGHCSGRDGARLDRVLERTPSLLRGIADPSLLHGDLWGGNVFPDAAGRPVLIDPAAYRGHAEVDLAMSELFGGFPPGWPDAYVEAAGLDPAYAAFRRDLYQLYYLLAHVVLFGASYEAGCRNAAEAVLRST